MSTTATGLRKRRTHMFVQVPSDTIRDKRLSFRARGLLAYLLDMPDGWDVKSDFLATQGKEGRGAVRTALHELGEHGYYRLERRRLLDGTFNMGTAISEEPVEQWSADYAEYEGKPVPCQQQRDRTFRVRHKDGTLTEDGFEVAVDATRGPDDDGPPAGVTGNRLSVAGDADFGAPDSGRLGPLRETDTRDTQGTTSVSLRSPADATTDGDSAADAPSPPPLTDSELETGRDDQGKPLRGKKLDALAQAVAVAWWEWIDQDGHSKPAQSFIACRGVIRAALGNGVPPKPVKKALVVITKEGRAVSGASLQIALHADTPKGGTASSAVDWDAAMRQAAARDAHRGVCV